MKTKMSQGALSLLVCFLLMSLLAEGLANSRPLLIINSQGIFFPAWINYSPKRFGQTGFVNDYREWAQQPAAADSLVVWPLVEWDPYEINVNVPHFPSPPSSSNWLGTDDRGRDVFTRLLYGFRLSFGFSLLIWLASSLIGIFFGALMGGRGGWFDFLGQRGVEVLEALPQLLIILAMAAFLSPSAIILGVLMVTFGWTRTASYVRAEFLRLKNQEFIEAARGQGVSTWRLWYRHLLPNALAPLLAFAPFEIAGWMSTIAVLDYFGFGFEAPTPTWGELLGQARDHFFDAWWLACFPSLALALVLICLMFVAEGMGFAELGSRLRVLPSKKGSKGLEGLL